MQACRELGLRTVAVFSEADRNSLHVQTADEAVCIGPPPNKESYLNVANIISACKVTRADAVHPGYGNLSEDPTFADACQECGITFVGPPAHVIARMGDKAEARRVVREAGIPVVPGSPGAVSDVRDARDIGAQLGYPVMLKAVSGGGGRGIRIAHNPAHLTQLFEQARSEARAAFGNGHLYVEKYLEQPRHVEVQVLADAHGQVVHLGERECSIQFRHQKVLEESPAPGVSSSLRRRMGEAAVKAAEAVGYVNAGTIEFLLDNRGRFYFIEMNTRIQVEHTVTEMVTGIDIVREQIKIAAGEKLSCEQGRIWFNGHAIECRLLAADGERGLLPSPGTITRWAVPCGPGVRVDTGVTAGSVVSSYYDPMIAKVVCWDRTRPEAITRMEATLRGMQVEGIKTTIPLHLRILRNAYFRSGRIDTHFIERRLGEEQPV